MPYKTIQLQLTYEQITEIEAVIGDSKKPFALLAQPKVRGEMTGQMKIYVATAEQYKAIDKGVREGWAMEEWS